MTLGQRLKNLRKQLHLSQEAIGAQGFVSAPGWIKIENSQRQPSDGLIGKFVRWLIEDEYIAGTPAERLREELLCLKYLGHRSEFVRGLARTRLQGLQSAGPLPALSVPEPVPRNRRSAAEPDGNAEAAESGRRRKGVRMKPGKKRVVPRRVRE